MIFTFMFSRSVGRTAGRYQETVWPW
jgi:hypothetical protein